MQFAHQGVDGHDRLARGEQGGLDERDLLAPLLAGARARGVADAFALLGLPVIFLGEAGEVLHVGAGARALLGDGISVMSGHLVGNGVAANRSLQSLLSAAVAGHPNAVVFVRRASGASLRLRALTFADAEVDEMQLLKVMVVLEPMPGSDAVDESPSAR